MSLNQILRVLAIVLSLPAVCRAGIADLRPYGPLPVRTQHPLLLQTLDLPIEGAQTLNKRQMTSELHTTFSNLFEVDRVGVTTFEFDMEVWRTALTWGYGVTDNFDVKIEVPFVTNSGGFLDGFIQWYHNLFNAPNGGRQRVPDNQFSFTLSQNGTALFNHPQTPLGLADVVVRAKYLLSSRWKDAPFKLAVAPYLKLPTGALFDGLSSGYPDVGGAVLIENALGRFHLVTQGGLVFLTGHRDASEIFSKLSFRFGQSVEYQIMDGWSAIAQITGSAGVFKNVDARDLKRPAVDLNFGFAGSFPLDHPFFDEFYYQFAFSEDVTASGPAVDFSVLWLAGVRY